MGRCDASKRESAPLPGFFVALLLRMTHPIEFISPRGERNRLAERAVFVSPGRSLERRIGAAVIPRSLFRIIVS